MSLFSTLRKRKEISKSLSSPPSGYRWELRTMRRESDKMYLRLYRGGEWVDWTWFYVDNAPAAAVECARWIIRRNRLTDRKKEI